MENNRQTPAYVVEAARRIAAGAPDFDETTLVAAFSALGAVALAAPSLLARPVRRAA